jgi:hypothetical protein
MKFFIESAGIEIEQRAHDGLAGRRSAPGQVSPGDHHKLTRKKLAGVSRRRSSAFRHLYRPASGEQATADGPKATLVD